MVSGSGEWEDPLRPHSLRNHNLKLVVTNVSMQLLGVVKSAWHDFGMGR